MSRFFIHRPIFAIVIAIIIMILGLLAIFSLPIAQYLQITQPTVSVSTSYLGANAGVINQTVAQIIEQQVNGTQGMDYMSSGSNDSGSYSLKVVFDLDTNSDMDAVLVQNSVSVSTAALPADVKNVGVTTKRASGDMAYFFRFTRPTVLLIARSFPITQMFTLLTSSSALKASAMSLLSPLNASPNSI